MFCITCSFPIRSIANRSIGNSCAPRRLVSQSPPLMTICRTLTDLAALTHYRIASRGSPTWPDPRASRLHCAGSSPLAIVLSSLLCVERGWHSACIHGCLQSTRITARRRLPTLAGDKVQFHLADVFLPAAEEIRHAFFDLDEIEGTITDFSDSGSVPKAFAVVEVILRQTMVVPVEKLELREQG